MRILYAVCIVIAAVLLFLTIFLGMVFSMYAAAAPSLQGSLALRSSSWLRLRFALRSSGYSNDTAHLQVWICNSHKPRTECPLSTHSRH